MGRSDLQPPATSRDAAAWPLPAPPRPVPQRGSLAKPGTAGSEPGKPCRLAKTRWEEFHWERQRREPQGGCVRPRPRPSGCSGGRACPPTGAFLSLRSGPDPGEKRTAPAILQPGSRVPALPPREGSHPPICCPSLACTCPCLQRQRSPRVPVHPGRLCAVPTCAGTRATGASPPSPPWPAGGDKEPKAHNTWLGTPGQEGPRAHSPSSPSLPALPAHKGRRPARRPGARLPESPGGGADPAPCRTPSPPSLPECQGPRDHVSSSQGGWPPRVRGLPGGASMPGHLRRRWTRLARRPRKGGGAARGPGPGRPDSWAAGSATVPAARPGAGRRQVWGARPHPHRKQGAPGAASVGGVGGQARSSRRAGGVAGGLGKALPGWPHLHNKRSEMEALVQRAIYKIQSQPPLAPQPPALPSGSALSPSLPRAQPPPAQPGLTTWPSQARPFNTSPPRLLAAAARCGQASRPPQSFRSWERGPEVLAACPPLQQAWAPWARGQAGGGGRARSPSLCAPPPPGARAAQQVLRNVPRPGVRGGREASLQPASCLLPPARLPAGRGGQGRGQPSLPAAQGPLVWGLAKATRVWKGPGSRPSRPTPRCPGPRQTDRSEKWAGGCPR